MNEVVGPMKLAATTDFSMARGILGTGGTAFVLWCQRAHPFEDVTSPHEVALRTTRDGVAYRIRRSS